MPVTMSYTCPFMVVVLLSLFIKSRIGGSAYGFPAASNISGWLKNMQVQEISS